MNVYDFDGTIYQRDSSVDFYRFCLGRHPGIAAEWPGQAWAAIRYGVRAISKTQMKQRFFAFLARLDDVDGLVGEFWDAHVGDTHAWYRQTQRPDDVVVTASPEWLVAEGARRMGIAHVIGSRVDKATGAFTGLNCHDEEKVARFRAQFPDAQVDDFYSDSLSDAPLARIAQRAFLVRGEQLGPWPGLGD